MRLKIVGVMASLLSAATVADAQIVGFGCRSGWGGGCSPYGYRSNGGRVAVTFSGGRFNGYLNVNRYYEVPWYGYGFGSGSFFYSPPPITYVQPIYVPVMSVDPFRPALPPLGPGIALDRRVLEPEPEILPPPPPPKPAVNPPKGELDPKADHQWFLRMGGEAFAVGDYELALRRFKQASLAAPAEPLGYFLQSQAELALGEFDKAAKAIETGLAKQPQWPLSDFQPRLLYGLKPAAYEKHLGALSEALGKKPKDDALLFVLGYQLWFDGRRDEAMMFFQRAAGLAVDTTAIDRFIKAVRPPRGGPVAER